MCSLLHPDLTHAEIDQLHAGRTRVTPASHVQARHLSSSKVFEVNDRPEAGAVLRALGDLTTYEDMQHGATLISVAVQYEADDDTWHGLVVLDGYSREQM